MLRVLMTLALLGGAASAQQPLNLVPETAINRALAFQSDGVVKPQSEMTAIEQYALCISDAAAAYTTSDEPAETIARAASVTCSPKLDSAVQALLGDLGLHGAGANTALIEDVRSRMIARAEQNAVTVVVLLRTAKDTEN
jgi:hypothetical protein